MRKRHKWLNKMALTFQDYFREQNVN